MIRTVLGLALGLAAVAAPALAADVATINCVSNKISPELRGQVAADYDVRLREPGRAMDIVLDDKLIAFGRECKALHGWSETAMNAAVAWTRSTIALPTTEAFSRAKGIDVDTIKQVWLATPEGTRSRQLVDADLQILGKTLQEKGVFKNPGDPTIVGRLIAYMNTNIFTRLDFIRG
ncbi:MAG: hypothetical protein EOP62_09835 [Sphingomonadales bacterium]|nr:MAG: hypothetical protein EOP62_09835 [Sphingomonadales bacterium]